MDEAGGHSGLSRKELLARFGRSGLTLAGVAGAAQVMGPLDAAQAAPDSSGRLYFADFGAVGDGVTDDAPALLRALDALGSAGGGELVVPPGRFALRSAVFKDFLNLATMVRIVGSGSASQLIVKTGGLTAVTTGNLEHLVVQGLTFVGTPGVDRDAGIVLAISYCDLATIRDCGFYGLAVSGSDIASVIHARHADLSIERCGFRGCTSSGSLVRSEEWMGFRIEDSLFFDYGTLNGTFFGTAIDVKSHAWIDVRHPWNHPQDSAGQGVVTVRNVRSDEGAAALVVDPGTSRISRVRIDGLEVNGNEDGFGVSVRNVDALRIENSFFGFSAEPIDAIRLAGVQEAVISRTICVQGANRITADADCGHLTLEQCTYTTVTSAAATTSIRKDGRGGVVPKIKAGPISDSDFDVPPPDGTLAVDTNTSRLSVRVGGVWKSVALSGTDDPVPTAPSKPTGLVATANGPTRVDLVWTANPAGENVTKYRIERAGALVAEPTGTSYSDTTVVASTSYSYTVTAVNGAGQAGPASDPAVVTTPAAPPVGGGTAFVSSFTPPRPRADFNGWVGMQLRVGGRDLQVLSLGRWVLAGNTGSHTVKLVDAASGADVPGGSVVVPTAGAAADAFRYADLAGPVTLLANGAYYLVSQETAGGDSWYDYDTRLVTTSAAAVVGVVYGLAVSSPSWVPGGTANMGYGPLSFRYTVP